LNTSAFIIAHIFIRFIIISTPWDLSFAPSASD